MTYATADGHVTELRQLLDAVGHCRAGQPVEGTQRFALIQRWIAGHDGEGCRSTGYPVAARP